MYHTMETTKALQPGVPSPAIIPKGCNIIVVDLKDCFFSQILCLMLTNNFINDLNIYRSNKL